MAGTFVTELCPENPEDIINQLSFQSILQLPLFIFMALFIQYMLAIGDLLSGGHQPGPGDLCLCVLPTSPTLGQQHRDTANVLYASELFSSYTKFALHLWLQK